jgi:Glycosyl transferases group 1
MSTPGPVAVPRRRVAMLTTVDFWNPSSGHRARILNLVRFLAPHVELTVVSPVALAPDAQGRVSRLAPGVRLHALALPTRGNMRDALVAVAAFFRAQPQQACIVQFLSLAWLRAAVPPGVQTLLDTHLVAGQHDRDVQRIGAGPKGSAITDEQEKTQLARFDRVIAICQPDADTFASWLGAERVLLAPHAQPVQALPVRPVLKRLMMVGGDYAPNHEGLRWFLSDVWPRLASRGLELHVVGAVGPAIGLESGPGIVVHGTTEDLSAHYAAADLCINPVRHGGGLKIKTVEALAHGRALVATSHGARSLESQAGQAFLVADDGAGFAAAIGSLIDHPELAARLASTGAALAEARFGAQACYGPLLRYLTQN